MAAADAAQRKGDLAVRTVSAVAMVTVAGLALWLGGWIWALFVFAVAAGVLFEWRTLVLLGLPPGKARALWSFAGVVYCAVAVVVLLDLRSMPGGILAVLTVLLAVIGTDVGAYFAGRTFGGPKIAPRISPSKTWSGLGGGVIGATLATALASSNNCVMEAPASALARWATCARMEGGMLVSDPVRTWLPFLLSGALVAIVAQAGDFFESWMKRRAGVKDSGKPIPGHGGLFDRVDGLLSVLFVLGIVMTIVRVLNV
jgi:phosphatidate cytidylyltransferase